uniref:Uncharacterized protein n=1 Tax=Phaeomonas parva TaxID=124430 RepID=A0A7S1UI46_9STRA|mmetsp:Transcript_46074/g.144176  ORF Transcript_46074/g.144176 Transcript_46074/m.144176 type:complete len:333 (+) Transcript_46074:1222-2220(+)
MFAEDKARAALGFGAAKVVEDSASPSSEGERSPKRSRPSVSTPESPSSPVSPTPQSSPRQTTERIQQHVFFQNVPAAITFVANEEKKNGRRIKPKWRCRGYQFFGPGKGLCLKQATHKATSGHLDMCKRCAACLADTRTARATKLTSMPARETEPFGFRLGPMVECAKDSASLYHATFIVTRVQGDVLVSPHIPQAHIPREGDHMRDAFAGCLAMERRATYSHEESRTSDENLRATELSDSDDASLKGTSELKPVVSLPEEPELALEQRQERQAALPQQAQKAEQVSRPKQGPNVVTTRRPGDEEEAVSGDTPRAVVRIGPVGTAQGPSFGL